MDTPRMSMLIVIAVCLLCASLEYGMAEGEMIPELITPQYDELADLHLETRLVHEGQPSAKIIAPASGEYREDAEAIATAVREICGVDLPIATDASPDAAVPLVGDLICLGNRSSNATIEELYNRHYCLLDLRYPGAGGYVVRSLHNPFGNGFNVLFIGGSDAAGVSSGAQQFIRRLRQADAAAGELAVDWVADIRMGDGVIVPDDPRDFEALVRNGNVTNMRTSRMYHTWDASDTYGGIGAFGWNSISKRMAMYYMTGDERHAREVVRFIFPDEQTLQEMQEIDGERFELGQNAITALSHYNSHGMVLYWDLIEESPAFTDEERLRISNAFAEQVDVRREESVYGLTAPPAYVGDRHGEYSALTLYCLARYFQTHYPSPMWEQCIRSATFAFAPFAEHTWLGASNDHLWWYNTMTEPLINWMLLTGDRTFFERGTIQQRLRAEEALISGRVPDWALDCSSLSYLHKLAYLTGDGRWLEYRDRTAQDVSGFRLGQSFWPEPELQPALPEDLVGEWNINWMPEPMWHWRESGLPLEDSFLFGSFRSSADAEGDFILLDGFNGAGRNPYHTFPVLELRLDGYTILKGYRNEVLTRTNGLTEPQIAMDGALRRTDLLGETAIAVGEVPNAPYCNWRRTLLQRTGQYALFVDDLSMRATTADLEVLTRWETATPKCEWDPDENALLMRSAAVSTVPADWQRIPARKANCTWAPDDELLVRGPLSLDTVILRATEPGDWLQMTFRLDEPLEGELFAELYQNCNTGRVRLLLDEEVVCEEYDIFTRTAGYDQVPLGRRSLAAGEHTLRAEVLGAHSGPERSFVSLSALLIRPDGASPQTPMARFRLAPSDLVAGERGGVVASLQWLGSARAGEELVFFSLLARDSDTIGEETACVRFADNAAALALPAPGVAAVGRYDELDAETAVLAADHLHAQGARAAGLGEILMQADHPVDLDWEFASGEMHIVATEPTEIALSLRPGAQLQLDQQPVMAEAGGDAMASLTVEAGRHLISNATPPENALNRLHERLAGLLADAQGARAALRTGDETAAPEIPALARTFSVELGKPVAALEVATDGDQPLICVAAGESVHLFAPDGRELRQMPADAEVTLLHWWPETSLLLAGCSDYQVIAFELDGTRRWVFHSEQAPGAIGWDRGSTAFKGLHGLDSGVYLNNESQSFVGSASTTEIVDRDGNLLARHVYLWGTVHRFQVIDGPDGTRNLLASANYTARNDAAVLNSALPDASRRSFTAVPEGHTYMGGWATMNRRHLRYEDLDGDGTREVISETNGTWNRVTVWSEDGTPLADASFGPGDGMTVRTMRDLDIVDVEGDGTSEIIVARSDGLVACLNHRCEPVWTARLEAAPNLLKAFVASDGSARIFVGCDDGMVAVLDGAGTMIRRDSISAPPVQLGFFEDAEAQVLVTVTSEGELTGFRADQ